MSHLHTAPGQHDQTVSAYIIRTDTPEPKLLLHMHRKVHKYLQFGGHVELNENPWQALSREILEESGYRLEQLTLLQPKLRITQLAGTRLHPQPVSLQTHNFPGLDHYHSDSSFAFTTTEEPLVSIGKGESPEIRAFTLKELRAIPADTIIENIRQTGIFILENLLDAWEPVDAASFGL